MSSFNSIYRTFSLYVERFDMYQVGFLMAVICVVGFVLMRGFGSRTDY